MELSETHAREDMSEIEVGKAASLSSGAHAPADSDSPTNSVDDMAHLLALSEQENRTVRRGEVVKGTVVSIDRDIVLVDIGTKSEGSIPFADVQAEVEANRLRVGDEIYVSVVEPEGRSEHPLLSVSRARAERGWESAQTASEAGVIFAVKVLEVNRGGLVADFEGLRGFVPTGQISSVRIAGVPAGPELEKLLSTLIGQTISVKVVEVNRKRNRLILSERLAVQDLRSQRKEQLVAELKEGEVRTGRVTSVTDFGAFVDLGGADGLVHLSELAWRQVAHPSEVVKVGDEVTVKVISVDQERQKVALSIRRTQPEPWLTATERYPVGSLVTGRVARLVDFGAFVRLDDGIEGLIHVSELSDRRVAHPRNVLQEGEDVTVRVLRVEPERRRIGLSLRQAAQPEDDVADWQLQSESRYDG